MARSIIPRSIGVHDGAFHADEVTACALLITFGLADRNKIVRTRDPSILETCDFICDVGGVYDPKNKLFDHHQAEYKGDFSSAGMVLLYLKDNGFVTPEEYHFINDALVLGVDAHDNGRIAQELGFCTFSHVIANFNPPSYESDARELDHAFNEALDFALGHITRLRERFKYLAECREIVKKAMEGNKVLLLFDKPVPWLENFFSLGGERHRALFVIMPAGFHWKLRGIPPDTAHRMQTRIPLPLEWAGLHGDELKKVTGIPGAIFCHKSRFTSVWQTKEDAIKALDLVLEKNAITEKNSF